MVTRCGTNTEPLCIRQFRLTQAINFYANQRINGRGVLTSSAMVGKILSRPQPSDLVRSCG